MNTSPQKMASAERNRRVDHVAAKLCRDVAQLDEPLDVLLIALGKTIASLVVQRVHPMGVKTISSVAAGLVELEVDSLVTRQAEAAEQTEAAHG